MFHHAVTNKPLLKDLYELITPNYATKWKEIGTLLDLPNERINIIEADNPGKTASCCNQMLQVWLQADIVATWEKLFNAIESPAVSIQLGNDNKVHMYVAR